jgi:Lar family restriction alleviation protein
LSERRLEPCPFCGQADRLALENVPHGDESAFYVACPGCACEGPWGKSEGSGRGYWNRRIPPPAVAELVAVCREAERRLGEYVADPNAVALRGAEQFLKKLTKALANFPEGQP